MRLSGSNFQNYSEFSLDIENLTVLIGDTNKGKSSIFRALKGILRNDIDASFVRIGQSAPLTLDLSIDGHLIGATRSSTGSSKYSVDGKLFAKLGGGLPNEVKLLGFNEINVGDFTFDPIFAKQHGGGHFLLEGSTPTALNTVLGAFANTEKLEIGKKEANLRIRNKNAEAKTLATEIADAEGRKLILSELSTKGNQITSQLHGLEGSLRVLEAKVTWIHQTQDIKQRLSPLRILLNSLSLPDITEALSLAAKKDAYATAAAAENKLTVLRSNIKYLNEITANWSSFVAYFRQVKAITETLELIQNKSASSAINILPELSNSIKALEESCVKSLRMETSIKYLLHCVMLKNRVQNNKSNLDKLNEELSLLKLTCPECGYVFEGV